MPAPRRMRETALKRLRRVRAKIAAEPLRIDMEQWINRADEVAPCGTAGCIAGWTLAATSSFQVTQAMEGHGSFQTRAARLLDLSWASAEALFFTDNWPREYATLYTDAYSDFREDAFGEGDVEFRRATQPIVLQVIDDVLAHRGVRWSSDYEPDIPEVPHAP